MRADRKLARQLISEQDPEWIIGAPPCTAFSIWNAGINFKKMDPAKVKAMIEEGRLHLRFMCSLYRRQIMNGKYFLHEHPASALSWRTEEIKALEKMALVQTIVGDQCQYGLVTPAEGDRTKLMPALKPTRFMSNSTVMLRQLGKRCDKSHEHQHIVGNRAKAAAFYPVPLVRAIIKGITLQATENAQIAAIMEETVKESMAAIPMRNVTDAQEEFGAATYSSVPKTSGGKVPVVYERPNFKHRYLDEYTGEVLAPHLIRSAIEDELNFLQLQGLGNLNHGGDA